MADLGGGAVRLATHRSNSQDKKIVELGIRVVCDISLHLYLLNDF